MKAVEFEWDPVKALTNQKKHGISFTEACHIFDDPFALLAPDETHSSATEKREWIIGDADGRILVVVFTKRATGIKIISARSASRKERMLYEIYKRIPL